MEDSRLIGAQGEKEGRKRGITTHCFTLSATQTLPAGGIKPLPTDQHHSLHTDQIRNSRPQKSEAFNERAHSAINVRPSLPVLWTSHFLLWKCSQIARSISPPATRGTERGCARQHTAMHGSTETPGFPKIWAVPRGNWNCYTEQQNSHQIVSVSVSHNTRSSAEQPEISHVNTPSIWATTPKEKKKNQVCTCLICISYALSQLASTGMLPQCWKLALTDIFPNKNSCCADN